MVGLRGLQTSKRARFRCGFNGLCALVLFFLFYTQDSFFNNDVHSVVYHWWSSKSAFDHAYVIPRRVEEVSVGLSRHTTEGRINSVRETDVSLCLGMYDHKGYASQCEFLVAHPECGSDGLFNYMKFFYCDCEKFRFLGYGGLMIWLAALFYLLGNTAADYFCCSLEKLSSLLKLSPTVAGVTLLPLGNGAPDVFASIAAFMGRDSGNVGLNSVLGGALFVTCVVVGTVSLLVAERRFQIDKNCFIRDVCFFLVAIVVLAVILIAGKVTVGAALAFVSIYVVYAFSVVANEILTKHAESLRLDNLMPMLPVKGSIFSDGCEENYSVYASLLETESQSDVPHLTPKMPHWMWATNVAIYSNETTKSGSNDSGPIWGWKDEETTTDHSSSSSAKLFTLLEMPLTLPRQLTIPIVEEERWSKGYAVASATFAPFLMAFLWNTRSEISILSRTVAYVIGVVVGIGFGILAYLHTSVDHPPRKFLFPWVLGGFVMSIVWFYIVANELVALLVGLGEIFGISPSVLGLTVLAWGNSMGDLMSSVALAVNGGDGIQIAMSGCYAGPMFNTLAGLGISLVLGAWSKRPLSFTIPKDNSLFYTIGFLISGLIWALIVLPRNDMRPNRFFGGGLLLLYLVFLLFKAVMAVSVSDLVTIS